MKPGCFYLIIPFAAALILSITGCPVSVGQCTYGKVPDQRGKVIIKSVEKAGSGYRVKVDGFFKRDFFYNNEDFLKNFTAKGYKTGTELDGIVTSGGPCPPMYRLSE